MAPRLPANAVLLLIDVQKGFDEPSWGSRNNPRAEETIVRLLEAWREAGRPVIHVQHLSADPGSPLHPDRPGCELRDEVLPVTGERLVQKRVNSAFIGTDLEASLRGAGQDTLVIAGLTTNHCVSTTTRMAGNLGFRTWLVADATATFDRCDHTGRHFDAETLHAAALASLHEEFAKVVDSEEVLSAARAEGGEGGPRGSTGSNGNQE